MAQSQTAHWAVILAGGEGRRLQALTRSLSGDIRPKQFCKLLGAQTLLAETRSRLEHIVGPDNLLYVVTKKHEAFYRRDLASVRSTQVLEQPSDRGTTTAVACALARLRQLARTPIVAFCPADHYYENVRAFRHGLLTAYEAAAREIDRVILVGVKATAAEIEYGWIEPGRALEPHTPMRAVAGFWEKPSSEQAGDLLARGCLWNTFTMVGSLGAFERLVDSAAPGLVGRFAPHRRSPPNRETIAADLDDVYASIGSSDFSRDVAATRPEKFGVLPLRGAGWTDLGRPDRVFTVLASVGRMVPRLQRP